MKLKTLFQMAVDAGMESDPRSEADIRKALKRVDDKHKKVTGKKREYLDHEKTWNPYLDSRILHGTGEEEIRTLMVGIDIETPEILLAHELRKSGKKIDALHVHHPEGRCLADLEKVVPLQIDILKQCGIPENRAEGMLRPRMTKIWRSIHADNLFRVERAAELLDIPIFGTHTITDNIAWAYIQKHICAKPFDVLEDVVDALYDIPEYEAYARKGNPPIIVHGSEDSRPGKICANEFTGGTNGPEELIQLQAEAGVGTILSMHATEKTVEAAQKHHINIIQCSHMASDALGMNLLIDYWQNNGAKLEIIECSGFLRVDRTKKDGSRKQKKK